MAILPRGLTRIFYSDNGSTAVEVALKMAYQFWQNPGRSESTGISLRCTTPFMANTSAGCPRVRATVFTKAFEPLLFPVHRAHAPYCYRCPLGLKRSDAEIDCLRPGADSAPHARFDCRRNRRTDAAGRRWHDCLADGVSRGCAPSSAIDTAPLMIADEVLTGFGRTGRMFACEHASVSSGFRFALSKALTAGYLPLAVTAATDESTSLSDDDRTKAFFHGHSYTANPLACAVALASLELFRTEGSLGRVEATERHFRSRFEPIRNRSIVGDIRGIGGVAAIELRTLQADISTVWVLVSPAHFLETGAHAETSRECSLLSCRPAWVLADGRSIGYSIRSKKFWLRSMNVLSVASAIPDNVVSNAQLEARSGPGIRLD